MNEEIAFELARQKILPFAVASFAQYEVALHHKLIARKLQDLEQRKIKRLMVFMPPRHGKSFLISQMFPAWYLGRNPTHQVIFTTYNQEVASDFGRRVRNMMVDPIYETMFPTVKVSDDSSSNKRFHTNSGGVYYAVGAGGPLTSRGGDLVIIDDIHKNREESHSEVIRKNIHEWYGSTLYTRLMPNAVMILVQTRWHEADLPGKLLTEQADQWDILNLPAINQSNEALWPSRFPIDTLTQIKRTIGSRDFEALYQQRPTPQEGGIIKRQWLKFYDILPREPEEWLISVDATFSGKATSDFVAMQTWARFGASKYFIDQVHARMGITETIDALVSLAKKWPKAKLKLIENKANGPAIEDLLKRHMSGIVLWEPTGDKVARMNAVAPQFEAGNVYFPLPSTHSWIQDTIEELVTFPNAAHDDRCDAISMALLRLEESASRNVGTIRVLQR